MRNFGQQQQKKTFEFDDENKRNVVTFNEKFDDSSTLLTSS